MGGRLFLGGDGRRPDLCSLFGPSGHHRPDRVGDEAVREPHSPTIANAYTVVFRGTPELLVLLIVYFGAAVTLTAIAQSFDPSIKFIDIPPFWAGAFAIALIVGAYMTETFRGAFLGVDPGHVEAARALGLSNFQTFVYVRIPQMWRLALPNFGNHMLSLMKDTALISVIGVEEIVFVAEMATTVTLKPFTMYIIVALIYLCITTVITLAVMALGEVRQQTPGDRPMTFDFGLVFGSIPKMLTGLGLTLELLFLSSFIGLVLAVITLLMRISGRWFLVAPAVAISTFFAAPHPGSDFRHLLRVAAVRDHSRRVVLWPILREPFWCCILALSLNAGAYVSEILRGGVLGVDKGVLEAASALGISKIQRFIYITSPIAIRLSLPAYSNDIISMTKATALASTVTLLDMTGVARTIVAQTFAPYEIFISAAIIYMSWRGWCRRVLACLKNE